MTKADLIKLLEPLDDDDAIVINDSNTKPMYKITGLDDTTIVGVYRIRFTEFISDNPWEK